MSIESTLIRRKPSKLGISGKIYNISKNLMGQDNGRQNNIRIMAINKIITSAD